MGIGELITKKKNGFQNSFLFFPLFLAAICSCNKDGKEDPDLKDGTNCGRNFKKDSYVHYNLKGKFCTAISDLMNTNIKLGFRYSRSKRLGKYEPDNNLSLQKKSHRSL